MQTSLLKNIILASSKLMQKNRAGSIGFAVALVLSFWIKRLATPPKHLRHIPYISHYTFFKAVFDGKTYVERSKYIHLPFMQANKLDLYLEPGDKGWELVVANPQDAKKVFLKQDLFPKSELFSKGYDQTLIAKMIGGPNVVFLNGHQWKKQRMTANPAFRRSMPVTMFGNLALDVFALMEEYGNKNLEMHELMERFTLESIGKSGFDFEFNCLRKDHKEGKWISIYHAIRDGLNAPLYFFFPALDQSLLFLNPRRRELHEKLDEFKGLIHRVIEQKKKSIAAGDKTNDALAENERDLLTLMIESEHRGEGAMTNEELQSNVMVFFMAGHDTTTSALTSALYFMAKYEDVQEKAREEAIRVLGDKQRDVIPSLDDMTKLKYIEQVMHETMRMVAPLPKVVPRVATEDTELSGVFIPKGTYVNVDIYDIHHNESVWKRPNEFNPDRFAEGGESSTHDAWTWLPFGGGSRQCLGFKYSTNQQKVLLSMMLKKYTWTISKNSIHQDDMVVVGFPTLQARDLRLDFKKRY